MSMTPAAIAANRFGLGMRGDALPITDPKAYLLQQMEAFEPRPSALADAPGRADIADTLVQYAIQRRAEKQQRASALAALANAASGPRAANPGPMSDVNIASPLPAATVGKGERSPAFIQARDDVRDLYLNNVAARFAVALTSRTPFVERLVHFWANHFAVSIDKPPVVAFAGSLEFDAVRPHVIGRFSDMLLAVEQHPAMLIYLDQVQSIGPGSIVGQRRTTNGNKKAGLNENLAREILELHTLGVRSGYSQTDVTEFARALTGWFVTGLVPNGPDQQPGVPGSPGATIFHDNQHEPGQRTILGRIYPQHGEAQSLAVLRDLAVHPATAQHVATKLARHFAGDNASAGLVTRLASAFQSSGGELARVYRVLVDAPECWVPRPLKFKTPWDWSVSALRALNLNSVDAKPSANMMVALGQQVWKPGSPAGYDDLDASWAAPDALVRRVEIAQRLAQRAGGAVDARTIAKAVLPGSVSSTTEAALGNAESGHQALAILFASPEFLRR